MSPLETTMIPDYNRVRGQILPRVLASGSPAAAPLVEGHLDVGLVLDTPGGLEPVTPAHLRHWDREIPELIPQALENLAVRSSPEAWIPVETVPGMHVYYCADGLASARALLLAELFHPEPLEGVLFVIPSEDQLLGVPLEGAHSLEAVRVLFATGGLAHESSEQPLTAHAFWFDGEQIHAVPLVHREQDVLAQPPPALVAALERLTALGTWKVAAEA